MALARKPSTLKQSLQQRSRWKQGFAPEPEPRLGLVWGPGWRAGKPREQGPTPRGGRAGCAAAKRVAQGRDGCPNEGSRPRGHCSLRLIQGERVGRAFQNQERLLVRRSRLARKAKTRAPTQTQTGAVSWRQGAQRFAAGQANVACVAVAHVPQRVAGLNEESRRGPRASHR